MLEALLEDPQVRPFVIQHVISAPVADEHFDLVISRLCADDFRDLYLNVRAGTFDESIATALLQHSDLSVRSTAAVAILLNSDSSEPPVPVDLLPQWRAAFEELPLPLSIGRRENRYFLERLVAVAPDIYERLLIRAVERGSDQEFYKSVQSLADLAPTLSLEAKTRVYDACRGTISERRHVFTILRGADLQWIESMLDSGAVDADFVDSTFNGFGAQVPIEDLARLLVPRGIDPMSIAMTTETGSYWGDPHEGLSGLVARMRGYAESDDPNIAAVGEAGIRRYEPQLQDGVRKHRENQVRGRW